MSAVFIVRAEMVDPAARDDFDRWYQEEHLPDAVKAFSARRAWRGWSDVKAGVHYAFYEFDDLEDIRAIQGSDALKNLVAEFDRTWGERVRRDRDAVPNIQQIEG